MVDRFVHKQYTPEQVTELVKLYEKKVSSAKPSTFRIDWTRMLDALYTIRELRLDLQGERNVNGYLNRQNIDVAKEIGDLRIDLNAAREALTELLRVLDASPYGEHGLHHHTCPAPDHGKCTCGAQAAVDAARVSIETEKN